MNNDLKRDIDIESSVEPKYNRIDGYSNSNSNIRNSFDRISKGGFDFSNNSNSISASSSTNTSTSSSTGTTNTNTSNSINNSTGTSSRNSIDNSVNKPPTTTTTTTSSTNMPTRIHPLNLSVMGLNSGTSIDSVDIVLCHFTQESPESPLQLKLSLYDEIPMPIDLKKRVLKLIRDNDSSPEELSQVNVKLGITFADAAIEFCEKHNIDISSIDLIASHGQTIWYVSDPKPNQTRSVLTMAEGAYISQRLSKTVVSDFRISEQSVGRQGAPMIAFFDGLLLVHPTKMRICQNIGGIANSCFILPEYLGGIDKVFDFDNGPGNIFIDAAMRYFTDGTLEYDKDGEWGKQGNIDHSIVEEYLSNESYFKRTPPKTTGRELFGDQIAINLIKKGLHKGLTKYDIIATITRITAQAIVNDYKKYGKDLSPIDELYLCGGGAHNPNIVNYIQENFPNMEILPLSSTGIPGGAKEAVTFAFQGMEAILGRPLIVPDRVESKEPVIVGKVTPGPNYRQLQALSVKFGENYPDSYLPSVRKLIVENK